MADEKGTKSTPAGLYLATQGQTPQRVEWLGIVLAILWLCVNGYILLSPSPNGAGTLVSVLLIF
ncbi:MAG: hypothetical protein RI946_1361, partial [Pseudomonadota bacterium]